jgi:hypothetical protein
MGLPLPFSIGHEVKFPLLFRLVEKEPKKGSDTQGRLCAKKNLNCLALERQRKAFQMRGLAEGWKTQAI